MAKITLTDVSNFTNDNSAVGNVNANNHAIETALENTLSRDGTGPNQMGADFDMNSFRILNLPAPILSNDAVRFQDLSTIVGGGTVSNIPTGGNTGDTLTKTSGVDFAMAWVADSASLSAGSNIVITGTSPATIATTLTPTFTTVNKVTITAPAASATLTIANTKTLTVSNTLTLAGTDATVLTFQGTDTYIGRATTDTLTNKTYDTAGAGNSLSIAGLAVTANSGTGAVVRVTSPALVTPALGTPTALVGTNITGTAAGLTAGTVTTNANLTGVITSVGNATSITSQTGTGTKFVTDTTPTLVTPILGVATATTINKVTFTTPATGSTLTIVNGATLTASATATVSGTNTGDQTITLTGDVTGTGTGSFAATIANSAVTSAKMANMNAFTFKGNNTGSAAAPTDVDISLLTVKASPVAADLVMIADSAASNAWKKVTVSSLASAGSVSSIAGNTGAFTLTNGLTNTVNAIGLTAGRLTLPTIQRFTTGTAATYTTPANCLWIRIRMVGGGSGGGGSGTSGAGASGAGTASTWSGGTLSAGGAASAGQGSNPTTGGAATGGNVLNIAGGSGTASNNATNDVSAGGAASAFGGAGGGSLQANAGGAAATNSGSGGGAGGVQLGTGSAGASAGGAGGYVEHIITSPVATYTYTVGTGGAGGTAGTAGAAGGVGGAGIIIVEEHYGS